MIYGVRKQHDVQLEAIVDRFEEHGLTLNDVEYKWGRVEMIWPGKLNGGGGMALDPEKESANGERLRNWFQRLDM